MRFNVKAAVILAALLFSTILAGQSKYIRFENLYKQNLDNMTLIEVYNYQDSLSGYGYYVYQNPLDLAKKFLIEADTQNCLVYIEIAKTRLFEKSEAEKLFSNSSKFLKAIDSIFSTPFDTSSYINLSVYKFLEMLYTQDQNDRGGTLNSEAIGDQVVLEQHDLWRIRQLITYVLRPYGFPMPDDFGHKSSVAVYIILIHAIHLLPLDEFKELDMVLFKAVEEFKIPLGSYCSMVDRYFWDNYRISKFGSSLAWRFGKEYTTYVEKNIVAINSNRTAVGYDIIQ